ncbi:hypothetical protein [Streptomyces sp. NPDC085479]|uniref:hypothetical protein n=1 Tax=Streptomyces sp. NPDC085479 TaxID=3365726 RepID=UPI0037D82A30
MSEESLHEILGDIERSVRDFTGAEAALAEAEQRRDRTRPRGTSVQRLSVRTIMVG